MRSIFLHLHPQKIHPEALRFTRTFGLGGMAALLILVQIFTGILLRFYYVASPVEAYDSVLHIKQQVLFGPMFRNLHYWSGVFLLMIAFLHFLRVFFSGAYRKKRSLNWLIGLILLFLVVLANFTGYLLPWDQLAYWAITVSTNIIGYLPFFGESLRVLVVGGMELSGSTLQNFYTFHTALIPLLMLLLVVYHFWRVRKAGGILIQDGRHEAEKVAVMPNLVFKEFIVALVLLAVLFLFSALFDAPLLEKANPSYSMNPTKAPWYFAGVQELLMHFHPFFAAFVIPASVIIFLAWAPYIKFEEEPSGVWFLSEKGRQSSVSTAWFAAGLTLAGILFNAWVFDFEVQMPWIPALVSNGLFPLIIVLTMLFLYYRYYLKSLNLSVSEKVQSAFVFIMVAFVILTVIAVFFRGKDMELTFPWNVIS